MQPKIATFSESLLKDTTVKDVIGTSGGAGGITILFNGEFKTQSRARWQIFT
jgi:hypothetical protein